MDRAKLIKAIECRKEARKRCGNPCEETGACAYARCVTDGNRTYLPYYCDVEQICDDAIALLKESETVKCGVFYRDDYKDEWYTYPNHCVSCGKTWMGPTNYCPNCGLKLKKVSTQEEKDESGRCD